ncbi:MAG: L-seryl-tRNA(Sec) selenium transferase [Desulfovibrio sp.]|nr:L-seryl-tRNA(Sec) selenium transferase [Desulfovibrio sp.]
MNTLFRAIPAVDTSLSALRAAAPELVGSPDAPHALLRDLVVEFWESRREAIRVGRYRHEADLTLERQLPALLSHVRKGLRPRVRSVLNGTGVVVHTNMGRSVLAREACEAVSLAAGNYCNLELNMETGGRGSRQAIIDPLLCRITGGENAFVVNNNAAALLLILDTFCKDGEVIISRGELVEIGGSFRIPDIMEKSGTILREVGTTNRTHEQDYRNAITEQTRAILRVHTSNYRIVGFHAEVGLSALHSLAQEHGLPLFMDLGSGSLLDFSSSGLHGEPTVQECIAHGADMVCFSGDKVLGGPQAGIIVGRHDMVERLKANPLARALRCDKLCLAALEATLRLYIDPERARRLVPTPRMMSLSAADLARAARSLARQIKHAIKTVELECDITLRPGISRVGGGAFPQYDLPTTLVCLAPVKGSAMALKTAFLQTTPALLGRLEDNAFCMDPRTIPISRFRDVASVTVQALHILAGR